MSRCWTSATPAVRFAPGHTPGQHRIASGAAVQVDGFGKRMLRMAHSLEVRPVLLDHKLEELAFSLDDNFKVRNGKLKSVFVDAVKDIIPSEVWHRKKTGFEMPLARWMNSGLNDMFKKVLDSKKAQRVFTKEYLSTLNKRAKRKNLKKIDWMSFVFLSWLDHYDVEI